LRGKSQGISILKTAEHPAILCDWDRVVALVDETAYSPVNEFFLT